MLLGYPLAMSMTPEVRHNDLKTYEAVTDPLGPAMTWVSHTLCLNHHALCGVCVSIIIFFIPVFVAHYILIKIGQ